MTAIKSNRGLSILDATTGFCRQMKIDKHIDHLALTSVVMRFPGLANKSLLGLEFAFLVHDTHFDVATIFEVLENI